MSGFERHVNELCEDVTEYNWGYQKGYEDARKTLRDEFAAKAMQATISNSKTMSELTRHYENGKFAEGKEFENVISTLAYLYADAMMEARNDH